ncbi:zinc/manganese transport system substrate-binding protein/manganese/iron transport system substrate-binding protein [Cryobacterium flavum]|uniref:Zinc ABC transporter substrate-binding protein n=1 Tax=Cryobacterium flavum TaxID=1424659 RepID=A0A4V3I934_9MICO|nr:metal ABC transporter substrate-binding protein [Cryobacterium flavum]TFB77603.1 zinc ABC transporter substrate-binding protein [Cryobacterium flavum]SDM51010.1 zinc/manganese transport system substrate-binding protein/manganese/iron transport system substrate-binding protein [Cryobacterium flavum]
MHKRSFIVPALLASTALALSGCSAGTTASADGADADLQIVATTTQVADFTRNVIGNASGVDLTQLIQPNQSAHSYDPSAADLTALGAADVLVINGVGLEEWLDDAIAASGFDGVTIDADTGITISEVGAGEDHTADEADAHTDEADAPATDDAHAHDGGDPHIWTDVHNAETIVQTITDGLVTADQGNASAFEANATAYTAQLTDLDEWIRTNVDTVPESERLLVSNHDALGYFTAAYHIDYVGSVIPSFDDNAEPSAAEIDALVAAIKATGVTAVFSEASLSPKTAETIATEAGVTVYSGDEALYVDSLGPTGSAGDTYIKAQLHNATLMLESWGVTPSPLPADLQ